MRYFSVLLTVLAILGGSVTMSFARQDAPAQVDAQQQVSPSGASEGEAAEEGEDGEEGDEGEAGSLDPDSLPVSLSRIQRRLSRPAAIRAETTRQVFRVEVFGRSPTIDEILGPNWRRGPVPYGGMTHQEFLNMVTPKDVQGYAAFDNRQGLMVAATSFALQWALRQAVQKLDDARTERQKEAAEREVNEALAALRRARRDAGLPDR